MSTPCVRGSLLASDFVSRELAATFPDPAGGARAAAFRRLRQWHARTRPALGPVSSVRTLVDRGALPIFDALGYALREVRHVDQPSGQTALLCAGSAGAVARLVIAWGAPLAGAWRPAVRHAMHAGLDWCFVFNGRAIRVVDARRTYARHFLEIDLEAATHDEADFARLWLLLHARRFDRGPTTNEQTFDRIVAASERHAAAVRGALQEGVHEAIETLLDAFVRATARRVARSPRSAPLARTGPSLESLFDHSLVVVYRVLFLLFAEARRLVPIWHPVYRDAYTIEALQEAVDPEPVEGSLGRRPATGLWEALQAIARLAYHGCNAGDLRVTAFNGRLFAPQGAPLADVVRLDETSVRQALASLIFAGTKAGGRHRVAYVDLGVEQLGAVYERVLEYEAAPVSQPRSCRNSEVASPRVQLLVRGARRKASGTFYTPRPLTDFLVRRTLHPLVRGSSARRILELRVLDPAMGSGAFLVGACRYLSTAYEAALIREGTVAPHDIDDQARAAFRRIVAQRCLFGVDLNPVASQLARLSLWLATLAVDRPLTFLDHHLRVGDSLLGASIPDLFRQPPGSASRATRPVALPLLELADLQGHVKAILPDRRSLSMRADDTAGIVREKEALLERLDARDSALGQWKALADLWCAGWFWPSSLPRRTYLALSDEIRLQQSWLPPTIAAPLLAEARAIAKARRFFHWTLEFPEVFFDEEGQPLADGGFDAVLGNPPWDMMRADTGDATRRTEGRALQSQTVRFARAAGVYCAHSHGHVNRYQLFVERALSLVRGGGRLGLVVPIGLATDHSSAALRRLLFSRAAIDTMVGFDNRAGIFPIHRGMRFLVSTATMGTETTQLRCRFGERDAAVLDAMADDPDEDPPEALPVTLTRQFLSRVSGEDCTVPELRSPADVVLFDKLTSLAPALGDDTGWGARFGRELNASDDREHFRAREGWATGSASSAKSVAAGTATGGLRPEARPTGRFLPVLEGKHVTPFRVDVDASVMGIHAAVAARLLDRALTFGRARVAYRDVAASTNRLTLIAAIVPAEAVTTHTLFCLKTDLDGPSQAFLCGVLNSFVANYLVRPRVSTHVTVALVERLPVPRPQPGTLMGAIASEMGVLAAALAIPECPAREKVAARLQALAAHLYGLTATELRHILSTFPLVDEAEKALVYEMYSRIDRLSAPA